MKRLRSAGAVLLVVLAVLTGCGGGDDVGGGDEHNAQDVSFAKEMVPHHQQAVLMADMALKQSTNLRLKELATRIKTAQSAEISTMSGWLATWGEEAADHTGHSTGGSDDLAGMKGMVSDADMNAMGSLSGPEFDRLFVKHMTAHHQGALEMAKEEIEKGRYEPAKALARDITVSQQKEIAELSQLPTS